MEVLQVVYHVYIIAIIVSKVPSRKIGQAYTWKGIFLQDIVIVERVVPVVAFDGVHTKSKSGFRVVVTGREGHLHHLVEHLDAVLSVAF